MRQSFLVIAISALLLPGCQSYAAHKAHRDGSAKTYVCSTGERVEVSYPDPDTALMIMQGQTFQLHVAMSADGSRYVGDGWQWWSKGLHDASLAPLKPGETIASSEGVACHTP